MSINIGNFDYRIIENGFHEITILKRSIRYEIYGYTDMWVEDQDWKAHILGFKDYSISSSIPNENDAVEYLKKKKDTFEDELRCYNLKNTILREIEVKL